MLSSSSEVVMALERIAFSPRTAVPHDDVTMCALDLGEILAEEASDREF